MKTPETVCGGIASLDTSTMYVKVVSPTSENGTICLPLPSTVISPGVTDPDPDT